MIYFIVIVVAVVALVLLRTMLSFNPNKNKVNQEKLNRQIDEYVDLLKKYQQKKKR
jgi:uncharacterized protein YggT (Ycf19 family)